MRRQFLIVVVFIACYSLVRAQQNDPKLLAIVEELGNKMEKLVVAEDLEAIVNMYGENAQYLPDAQRAYSGKADIRLQWQQTFQVDVVQFDMNTLTVGGNLDMIYETGIGKSKVKYNDQEAEFGFKFVNVWERQANGEYKLVVDIYNRDVPQK